MQLYLQDTRVNINNTVTRVADGELALRFLREQSSNDEYINTLPDLIFMDIKMPHLNGTEALEMLKSDSRLNHIPVVMFSTSTENEEILRCFKLGACGYTTKPLQFEEFTRKLKTLNLYWALTSELPQPTMQ